MHLRRQIEELIKSGKLSHVIKELKQGSGKDQPKAAKKGETSGKDKPLAILMVQPWQRVARQKITQSFSPNPKISFPPLGDEDGTEGPMIIEAEIGGSLEDITRLDTSKPNTYTLKNTSFKRRSSIKLYVPNVRRTCHLYAALTFKSKIVNIALTQQ
ncbi:hypothetical protein Tco_0124206, partial [Tanacetum coccineum]